MDAELIGIIKKLVRDAGFAGGALKGDKGDDGRSPEFNTSATHIQWRLEGDAAWKDLAALSELMPKDGEDGEDGKDGGDGRTPELGISGGFICWRFTGEDLWNNLIPLEALKGLPGEPGKDGTGSGGGYEPPDGGIPRGDLAEDVKESLERADSAYFTKEEISQIFQEHIVFLLEDKGSVPARADLPPAADNFDAYQIEDKDLIVFAYNRSNGLAWLALDFFSAGGMDQALLAKINGKADQNDVDEAIAALDQAKLGKTETAEDSALFDGKPAGEFAQKDSGGKIPASAIPIAEENTVGGVMPGNGMSVDAQGRLNWAGQIPQISYWISTQNLLTGQIGGAASVFFDSVSKISGTHASPEQSDVCYSNDGYCFIVQAVNAEMNMIDGAIVQTPPPSAVWSNIQGALRNNQVIPAALADGSGNIGILWLNASNAVQLGDPSYGVNVNSGGRLTNNFKPVALSDELAAVNSALQGRIENEETERSSSFQNLASTILSEAAARAQADGALQQSIDAEIQARTQADSNLSSRIDSIIDDSRLDSYSSTLSANEIINQISKVYQPIEDAAAPGDLPEETDLVGPSICYVDSTQTTWINSKTGNGWKDTGANFATTSDIQNYLIDNGYLKNSQIVDNLLSDDGGALLSARQGKILQTVKIGIDQIINNLLTDDAAKPLSAAMGKWLHDNSFKITDIVDSLSSSLADKALAANQGRVLNDKIVALEGLFTNGKANQALQADAALAATKLSAQRRIKLNLTGYASGEGEVDTDLSGNVTLNINTRGMAKSGTNAIIRTEFYIPQSNLADGGCYKWFTIESSATTQSTLYIKFQHAWHGMIEVFIPFFNYNSNLFIDAASSKWGARRMPGNFGYGNRHADYKIRWFRKDSLKTEFWLKPNGLNARAVADLCFEVNGSISEENITFAPDFLITAGRKTAWPKNSDGYLGGCSEIDTALAASGSGYVYEASITYSTSLT